MKVGAPHSRRLLWRSSQAVAVLFVPVAEVRKGVGLLPTAVPEPAQTDTEIRCFSVASKTTAPLRSDPKHSPTRGAYRPEVDALMLPEETATAEVVELKVGLTVGAVWTGVAGVAVVSATAPPVVAGVAGTALSGGPGCTGLSVM